MDDLEAVIGVDTSTREAEDLPLSVPTSGLSNSDVVEATTSVDSPIISDDPVTKGDKGNSFKNRGEEAWSDNLAAQSDWPSRVWIVKLRVTSYELRVTS